MTAEELFNIIVPRWAARSSLGAAYINNLAERRRDEIIEILKPLAAHINKKRAAAREAKRDDPSEPVLTPELETDIAANYDRFIDRFEQELKATGSVEQAIANIKAEPATESMRGGHRPWFLHHKYRSQVCELERAEACPSPRQRAAPRGEAMSVWSRDRMITWARNRGLDEGRKGKLISNSETIELGLATLRDQAPFWSQVLDDVGETGGELQDDVVTAFVEGYESARKRSRRGDDETSHYRGN